METEGRADNKLSRDCVEKKDEGADLNAFYREQWALPAILIHMPNYACYKVLERMWREERNQVTFCGLLSKRNCYRRAKAHQRQQVKAIGQGRICWCTLVGSFFLRNGELDSSWRMDGNNVRRLTKTLGVVIESKWRREGEQIINWAGIVLRRRTRGQALTRLSRKLNITSDVNPRALLCFW